MHIGTFIYIIDIDIDIDIDMCMYEEAKEQGKMRSMIAGSEKESESEENSSSPPNSPTGVNFGYNIDDYFYSKFKAVISNDLFYVRPSSHIFFEAALWVFRSDPTPLAGKKVSATRNRNLTIKEKITYALLNVEYSSANLDILVQFWAPVTIGGRCFLATSDQPFGMTRDDEGLCAFRKLCMDYRFYVDMDTGEKDFSLIGRAFMQKSPTFYGEWQCCSNEEYPQLDLLVQCKIKGFGILPVLQPSSMGCVGVIELLATAEDTREALHYYAETIRETLEAVDLKACDDYNHFRRSVDASDQELIEELFVVVIDSSTEKNFDTYQIDLATKSPPRTHDLLNGGGLQLTVEDDMIHNGNDVIRAGKNDFTATDLVREGKIKTTKREHREKETSISYEVLKGHFGTKHEVAAEKLGVSRSKLKRLCRQNGLPRWPSHKRNKVTHPVPDQDPSSSNPPTDREMQDGRTTTVKAAYRDDIIMFQLSFSAGMIDLEEEVGKRLKLETGTFKIKYVDRDGDRILLACDADLKNCIPILTSSGITTIKMLVEPRTLL